MIRALWLVVGGIPGTYVVSYLFGLYHHVCEHVHTKQSQPSPLSTESGVTNRSGVVVDHFPEFYPRDSGSWHAPRWHLPYLRRFLFVGSSGNSLACLVMSQDRLRCSSWMPGMPGMYLYLCSNMMSNVLECCIILFHRPLNVVF